MIAITSRVGNDTIVTVAADPAHDTLTSDLGITGHGVARLRPGDFDVPATGQRIALGRAIQDYGAQVEAAGLDESVCGCEVERVIHALALAGVTAVEIG